MYDTLKSKVQNIIISKGNTCSDLMTLTLIYFISGIK